MNTSNEADSKLGNGFPATGAAKNLAESMWAMLNTASGSLPLEVTQDLALKMVTVLAEVNGISNSVPKTEHNPHTGIRPQSVPLLTAEPSGAVSPELPENSTLRRSDDSLSLNRSSTHEGPASKGVPRGVESTNSSEYWEELPPIAAEIPRANSSVATPGSLVGLSSNPEGEFWTELPGIVSENQIPRSSQTVGSRPISPSQGSYTSRAIALRETPSQKESHGNDYELRETESQSRPLKDINLGSSSPSGEAIERGSQSHGIRRQIKTLPLKLPPIPEKPTKDVGAIPAETPVSVRERSASPSKSGSSFTSARTSSPSLGSLGLDTPSAGGNAHLSDDEIQGKIERVLESSMIPAFSSLKIIVFNGCAILKGKVETDYERKLAIQMIRRVPGVRKVDDALQVLELQSPQKNTLGMSSSKGRPDRTKSKRQKADLDDSDNGWILRYRRQLVAACIALLAIGYTFWPRGNGSEPLVNKLVPVSGKLLLEEESLSGAQLTFFAMRSDKEFDSPVMTTTIKDGMFKIGDHWNKLGLRPGKYAVVVEYQAVTIGEDGEAVFGPNLIPRVYCKPETSPLKIEIAENKSEIGPLKISTEDVPEEMNL